MYFVYFPYSDCSMLKFTYSGPHRWLPDHNKKHKYANVISFFLSKSLFRYDSRRTVYLKTPDVIYGFSSLCVRIQLYVIWADRYKIEIHTTQHNVEEKKVENYYGMEKYNTQKSSINVYNTLIIINEKISLSAISAIIRKFYLK